MLTEHLDPARAGAHAGYDDAAHFNQEYKSLYDPPSVHDVEPLREASKVNIPEQLCKVLRMRGMLRWLPDAVCFSSPDRLTHDDAPRIRARATVYPKRAPLVVEIAVAHVSYQ